MNSLLRRNNQEKKEDTIRLRNGALLLEKLITSCNGKWNPIRSFSTKELKIATNNIGQYQIIVHERYKLYKGFLQNRPVSIMCWYGNRHNNWVEDECYNNIVFASQMIHKNVLKLIGCCVDTEIPTLVFESAENVTLADRIHRRHAPDFVPLLLEHRFKIAMDIANAVAYLHIGFRRPIVFRNIKPSNILLDEQNVAKLFDFSMSEYIPEGETHIKNGLVMGTIGFVAPEYMITSDCNEKCDVFSFGMLLLELLTGKRVINLASVARDDCYLLDYVKEHVENNRLNEIVDPIIVEDSSCHGKEEQLQVFVQLALECVNESPLERPTMMYVAKLLRQMYRSVV